MAKYLKVNKVLGPTRCEVCHQSDCLMPGAEVCSRCQPTMPELALKEKVFAQQGSIPEVDPHLVAIVQANAEKYHQWEARLEVIGLGLKKAWPFGLTLLISSGVWAIAYGWVLFEEFPWMLLAQLIPLIPFLLMPLMITGRCIICLTRQTK